MTDLDLFGNPLPPPRGKHHLEPRGYADRPGSGPEGETCGSCRHLARLKMARVYLKCELARGNWTGGAKTDVRAGSPACSLWEAKHVAESSTASESPCE